MEDRSKLVGVWEKVDPETKKTIDIYTFWNDGTFASSKFAPHSSVEKKKVPVGQPECEFVLTESTLALYVDVDPGPVIKSRNPNIKSMRSDLGTGHLKWVDDRLFEYTSLGRDDKGRVYEFHRLDTVNPASIIGTWTSPGNSVAFRNDGSYSGTIHAGPQAGADGTFKFGNGVLEIYQFDQTRRENYQVYKGIVEWLEDEHTAFSLRRLWSLGPQIITGDATQLKFTKAADSAPRPGPKQVVLNSPGGKVGKLTGVWEFMDPKIKKQARLVVFKDNGSMDVFIKGRTIGEYQRNTSLEYQYEAGRSGSGQLTVSSVYSSMYRGGQTSAEKGTISSWTDGDFFIYRIDEGLWNGYRNGDTFECHRLGDPQDAKQGNLVEGVWEVDLPGKMFGNKSYYKNVKFGRDGRCYGFTNSETQYKYIGGLLSVRETDSDMLIYWGAVTWDSDTFTLTVIGGARGAGFLDESDRVMQFHHPQQAGGVGSAPAPAPAGIRALGSGGVQAPTRNQRPK
jgi:hypothetical protein